MTPLRWCHIVRGKPCGLWNYTDLDPNQHPRHFGLLGPVHVERLFTEDELRAEVERLKERKE